ncbi:MAG: chromosome segregation protein SMC [Ahrensia sp.]|nr:chromosome segregation protein SMC [Ahrensia sp.]
MEFNRLRLLGFKSFVEPTEFAIERGLTGVVGPNGCGKSNLVEALRWVMGENSYKNMRAASMDEVIFSGSGNRPSRNMAEVALFLDNAKRLAPAAFNDADELQVSRRIEREAGSVYRINGRDVRAKDVQLLFADVSTGARSPSMIGQGRIGELISAKPQARRALLEEAAGISGLHSRRHEAELRLRAAENNLERLEDVIAQLDAQLESLKRQARQATRYRNIAGDIRRAEATLLHLRWIATRQQLSDAEKAFQAATVSVGEAALVQTEAAKAQAIIASQLPKARDAESQAATALQSLLVAQRQLEDEAIRMTRRREEMQARAEQLQGDIAREERLVSENSDIISHLDAEEAQLQREADGSGEREEALKAALDDAAARLATSEEHLGQLTGKRAAAQASADQAQRDLRETTARCDRLQQQEEQANRELSALEGEIAAQSQVQSMSKALSEAEGTFETAQKNSTECERHLEAMRLAEQEASKPVADAKQRLNSIETEAKTLSKVINAGGADLFAPVLDEIRVEQGYEKALGAALGEDLDSPIDASAPSHWAVIEAGNDPDLPDGVEALSSRVQSPEALSRRLAQIGVVDRADGDRLAKHLSAGQRLVTLQGDLWRWDGFRASAEAPTASAVKLEQKNRLAELDEAAVATVKELRRLETEHHETQQALQQATEADRSARDTVREAQGAASHARQALAEAERSVSQLANRRSALSEALSRIGYDLVEARAQQVAAQHAQSSLPDIEALNGEILSGRDAVSQLRSQALDAGAAYEGLQRENRARNDRLSAIARERETWRGRLTGADRQLATLRERLDEVQAEIAIADEAPDDIAVKRRALMAQIEEAETKRKDAADALASLENDQRDADKAATVAIDALSENKQQAARAEERVDAASQRRAEIEDRIREEIQCEPHEAIARTGLKEDADLPDAEQIERKLERLKVERERLGAVNLRAEEEQREIDQQRSGLVSERDDLLEAIAELRKGISSLNREGRERLLAAFDDVNAQFQKLFAHLFGGGTAELQLVESDDPLEAGLEILARPPGKKPQTMTLLSGGEQALTALALIFAVFLTNPAPICVLDEVDAPLDDHNVERFCNLMDQMSETTDTRFVIITHNPITMARMDRLFGVTMAERGVSQLVSVDLKTAESYREAG